MGERIRKSRSGVHLKQQVGDPDRRQAVFHLRFQRLRDVREHGLVRRDAETRAGQFDIVELTGFRQTGKLAQPVVQSLTLLLQISFYIGIDGDRKRTFLAHQLECRRRNEEALEGLEALGSLHPDIAGIEAAFQFAEQAEFIGPAIDLAILEDERHPAFRRKGDWSLVRDRAFARAVQIGDHGERPQEIRRHGVATKHKRRQEFRRHLPDRWIALKHFDFPIDAVGGDQRVDRLDTGREDRPLNDRFERPADILALLPGLDDRVANFRNVLQRLLNLPDGTGDAGGRLIVGSPRHGADQLLEHVDCAIG
ncbi:hypothetical protein Brsp07_05469 [Brucella sp. NBRC 14130]